MDVYIYGAGVYGKQCYEKICILGLNVKSFIVTEHKNNPFFLYDIPVVELKDFKTNKNQALIFLALKDEYKKSVFSKLASLGFKNIIEYSPRNYRNVNQYDFLINKCKRSKKTYIYGAGKYAENCYNLLNGNGVEIEAFVVTKPTNGGEHMHDVRIIGVNELNFTPDDFMIIAVNDDFKKEVLPVIERRGIKNFVLYTPVNFPQKQDGKDTEILQLRELATDFAYKLIQMKPDGEKSEFYEDNMDFSNCKTDIKALALYLPQYHTFKENDEWWGKGFTEWTNVKKGRPRYLGHNQPRIPDSEFGYYNLLNPNIFLKQINLAKQHGLYGFAFYFYWFSGKKLMEQPLDMYLAHKEFDFPFLFVWANENWTRRWDGLDNEILIKQDYNLKDPYNLMADIKKFIDDKRYIRINSRPILCIYKPAGIPNLAKFILNLRAAAKEIGIGDLLLWSCMGQGELTSLEANNLFDGQYEFPPLGMPNLEVTKRPYDGVSKSYAELVNKSKSLEKKYAKLNVNTFRGSMLEWDNSARKENGYSSFDDFSSDKFYVLNKIIIDYTRRRFKQDNRFIFINAWNEWGEGTYLEPDKKYGYANLNALSKALFDEVYSENYTRYVGLEYKNNCPPIFDDRLMNNTSIAIQAHVFYQEIISEIIEKTNNIPYPFDLYITTDNLEKKEYIERYAHANSNAKHCVVDIVTNQGRDVFPFLTQAKKIVDKYEFICHLHTKKSLHTCFGDMWRDYLYENLLGTQRLITDIFNIFLTEKNVGFISPQNIDFVASQVEWGRNRENCNNLMKKMNPNYKISNEPYFPAGNMFWARTKCIKPLIDLNFSESDFESEAKQVDGTLAHAVERIWFYLMDSQGYKHIETRCFSDNRPLFYKKVFKKNESETK